MISLYRKTNGGFRMKKSTLEQNETSIDVVQLVQRLVDMIPWPFAARRWPM